MRAIQAAWSYLTLSGDAPQDGDSATAAFTDHGGDGANHSPPHHQHHGGSGGGDGVAPGSVVLYGIGIGTGPALALAGSAPVRHTVGGVVLESALYSGAAAVVGRGAPRWLLGVGELAALLPGAVDLWRNHVAVRSVECPVALMHGTCDEVVPLAHAQRLARLCQSPVRTFWIDLASHGALPKVACDGYTADFLRFVADPAASAPASREHDQELGIGDFSQALRDAYDDDVELALAREYDDSNEQYDGGPSEGFSLSAFSAENFENEETRCTVS
jgi:fermentation-respiration switch protein FrsA (DUF1100 family)